ncbi:MAG TPA: haloacid dehalogenase-like hydrolase [Candidatus Angelobacter sp.]|nr:haloacid dehalogenase-like hydrolase [Candidatus Angelobacter sp.]
MKTESPNAPKESPKLSAAAQKFVDAVIALKPQVAVFDCDGTLWSGDAGADFFFWEIKRGMIPANVAEWAKARYADYKEGLVDEETMCGEMVTINDGVPEQTLQEANEKFFAQVVAPRIFPEMPHLTRRLVKAGCELWAVSSTNIWTIREGIKHFGIPEGNVLAAGVQIVDGRATDRLIRVPTDDEKAMAIEDTIKRPVDVCFGNSIHDAAMLQISSNPYAVNPTLELERIAVKKGWKVYWPTGTK